MDHGSLKRKLISEESEHNKVPTFSDQSEISSDLAESEHSDDITLASTADETSKEGFDNDFVNAKFALAISDFKDVADSCHFVDHTLLISEFLKDKNSKIMVTAPARFGKSTNLSMLKRFAEIEIDSRGIPLKSILKPVTGTPNYAIYSQNRYGQRLQIMEGEHRKVVEEHFGRHPIIHINLAVGRYVTYVPGETVGCAREYITNIELRFKDIVFRAYLEHHYLQYSDHLSEDERNHCKRHSSNIWCSLSTCSPESALYLLSYYLWKHFGTRCWLLVDEYDAIITEALFDLSREAVNEIVKASNKLLSNIIKNNDVYVSRAFLTGVSTIFSVDFASFNNVFLYTFLRNHPYSKFYGLSIEKVSGLLGRLQNGCKMLGKIDYCYNGYYREGSACVYDPWSIMNYLANERLLSYWSSYASIRNLKQLFNISDIQERIIKLLDGEIVYADIYYRITMDLLLELKDQINNPTRYREAASDLFFSFLFEQGYLSFTQKEHQLVIEGDEEGIDRNWLEGDEVMKEHMAIKMPNQQLHRKFYLHLKSYYSDCIREIFKDAEKKMCTDIFQSLAHVDVTTQEFNENVERLFNGVKELFNKFSEKFVPRINEAAVHSFISLVASFAEGWQSIEETHVARKRLGFLVVKGPSAVLLEVKVYRENDSTTTSTAALQQIGDGKYYNTFIRGNIAGTNHTINNCVMIGLSVGPTCNGNVQLEMHCVKDKRNSANKFSLQTIGFPSLLATSLHFARE